MRKRTFVIVLVAAVAIAWLAIAMREDGSGMLTRLISSIPGH
jgi:hypothetical protein